MNSKTVVVTGAAGFIGRWVTAELLDRGYKVKGIDNFSNGRYKNVEEFTDNRDFSLKEADVRNEDDIDTMFDSETNACIHLAAEIDVQESLNNPGEHFETNTIGTKNLLEVCRTIDTRFVLVGTCMVYDMADSQAGIDESHPVKPASPYAGSKLAAENLAESYFHSYDLPVTILRPFNTYGPYQKTGMAGGVVSIFVDRNLRNETIKIFGDGTQTRDLLYATDCARFIVDATFEDDTIGEIINAGTGSDISINKLANIIASDETDTTHITHHHPQSEVKKLLCDPTKAERMLDWKPMVSIEEGVDQLHEWMKEETESHM